MNLKGKRSWQPESRYDCFPYPEWTNKMKRRIRRWHLKGQQALIQRLAHQ